MTGPEVTGPATPPRHRLETPRLVITALHPEEAARLLENVRPPGQAWAHGYPLDGTYVAASALVWRHEVSGPLPPGFGMYQVVERDSGLVVGDIGFHAAPDDTGTVEVGYGVVPARRGRGIATEALRALVSWALAQPGVREVCAGTEPDHVASQRVLLHAGFVLTSSEGPEWRYRRGVEA